MKWGIRVQIYSFVLGYLVFLALLAKTLLFSLFRCLMTVLKAFCQNCICSVWIIKCGLYASWAQLSDGILKKMPLTLSWLCSATATKSSGSPSIYERMCICMCLYSKCLLKTFAMRLHSIHLIVSTLNHSGFVSKSPFNLMRLTNSGNPDSNKYSETTPKKPFAKCLG